MAPFNLAQKGTQKALLKVAAVDDLKRTVTVTDNGESYVFGKGTALHASGPLAIGETIEASICIPVLISQNLELLGAIGYLNSFVAVPASRLQAKEPVEVGREKLPLDSLLGDSWWMKKIVVENYTRAGMDSNNPKFYDCRSSEGGMSGMSKLEKLIQKLYYDRDTNFQLNIALGCYVKGEENWAAKGSPTVKLVETLPQSSSSQASLTAAIPEGFDPSILIEKPVVVYGTISFPEHDGSNSNLSREIDAIKDLRESIAVSASRDGGGKTDADAQMEAIKKHVVLKSVQDSFNFLAHYIAPAVPYSAWEYHDFRRTYETFPDPKLAQHGAPIKISLIYSNGGMTESDFHKALSHRSQGERAFVEVLETCIESNAKEQIIAGIIGSPKDADIIALVRGGRTANPAIYNDKELLGAWLTRKGYKITGVGHAQDSSMLDVFSDHSATTPSATGAFIAETIKHSSVVAMERIGKDLKDIQEHIKNQKERREPYYIEQMVLDNLKQLLEKSSLLLESNEGFQQNIVSGVINGLKNELSGHENELDMVLPTLHAICDALKIRRPPCRPADGGNKYERRFNVDDLATENYKKSPLERTKQASL